MVLAITPVALLVTWLLVAVIRKIALRAGVMDIPNQRSSHALPTPRGGGGAIVIVAFAGGAIDVVWGAVTLQAGLYLAVGGLLIALTGLADDVWSLSPRARLALQASAAVALLVAARGMPPVVLGHATVNLGVIGWVVGFFTILWSVNLFNFMDGIDGIAAAQSLFVFGGAVLILWIGGHQAWIWMSMLALVGASAGFLVWNFPPAKIFMGDVGSSFIGFAVAAGAFFAARQEFTNVWTWLILDALFFTDATVTLITRLLRRQRVYEAHRSHAYQRLARRWNSHTKVTLGYAIVNLGWCLPCAIASVYLPDWGLPIACVAIAPLGALAIATGAGRADDYCDLLAIGGVSRVLG